MNTPLDSEQEEMLIEESRNARDNAYAPYSDHSVGAALAVRDGNKVTVYTGGNIENCNFTNTLHAEQASISSAIASGEDSDDFLALAVSTDVQEGDAPCGLCQQTLAEFVSDEFSLLLDTGGGYRTIILGEADLFRIDL